MNSHISAIARFSTFVFAAGCATGGVSRTTETTGTVANSGDGQPHHSRGLCTPSSTSAAPSNGLVSDFSALGGARGQDSQISSEIVTYSVPKLSDPGALTYSTTGGNLNIKVSAPATSRPQFLGTMVLFNSCIDASTFSGVQFSISGSFSDCSLTYATGDVAHEDATISSTFSSGPAGSYAPHHKISAADLSSIPRTMKLPFAATDIQGNPSTPIDPTKLIFTLWQFVVPVAADDGSATPPCSASLTIRDIKFYR